MVEWVFNGYNPSRFCYSKISFQQLIEFWFFHRAETSLVIATDTVLHFNHLCMSRPNKGKFLCWQIFHIVDALHATSANFTQRRITPRAQTKRKTATNKSEYSFSKHKNPKQKPCDRTHSSEEELIYYDFHKKSRLRIKFTAFPTNNQP